MTDERREPVPANAIQIGGDHYKQFGDLQPWDVINYFKLGYFDGNAVKYILRWMHKGGTVDLEKARHYLTKLLELEYARKKADAEKTA